jgi:hypothetical protein
MDNAVWISIQSYVENTTRYRQRRFWFIEVQRDCADPFDTDFGDSDRTSYLKYKSEV